MAKCGSWPHCNDEPAAGKRFCKVHQAILDRVKAGPKAYKTTVPKANKRTPGPVTVTKTPGKRIALEDEIVQTLKQAAEPMSIMQVREKLNIKRENGTFNRARDALLSEGRITRTGVGRAGRYSLAQGD